MAIDLTRAKSDFLHADSWFVWMVGGQIVVSYYTAIDWGDATLDFLETEIQKRQSFDCSIISSQESYALTWNGSEISPNLAFFLF